MDNGQTLRGQRCKITSTTKQLGEHTQDLNDRIDELEAELREAHGEAVDLSEAFELEAEHAHDLQARLAESQNDYQSLLYAAEHGVVS